MGLFFGSLVAYGIVLVVTQRQLEAHVFAKATVIVLCLLPVIPLLGVAAASIAQYYALDELQRRIQAEGIMFGFAVTAVGSLSYGFLEDANLVPHLSFLAVWPMLAGGWIVGALVAKRRYH